MDEYKRRRRRSRAVMSMFLDSLGGIIDNVDVATFDSDGTDLKALVVGIEPVQSGTGDPSPDNERPITGHSSVNVIVSPTLNPLDGTITNIPLGTTVYGGTLDVTTGVLTVEWVIVDLGTLNWSYGVASYTYYYASAPGGKLGVQTNGICSAYKFTELGPPFATMYSVSVGTPYISTGYCGIAVKDDRYAGDVAAFKAALNGVQLVYELATPTTIQLTGQQIATFLGTNNVWCDSGKIIHLEY